MSTTVIPLLIVEDNPMYAEILQRLLPTLDPDLQFDTRWVDTAEKADQELATTAYELVLLDYKLPGANGLEVLGRIRQMPAERQPAVIMLTGMGNETIAVEAMKNGAKDYLAKDHLDVPSLLRALLGARERKHLEQQVAGYTRELRRRNEEIQADLVMAREIQQALLPNRYPRFPAGADSETTRLVFTHRYQPTSSVGGDFFDVLALSDTLAGVFIGDVMGHGVRAALVTAILRALVGELLPQARDPGLFLTKMNERLLRLLIQTRMPMFVSAFYLVADTTRGELRYAAAGHPDPLLVSRQLRTAQRLHNRAHGPGPALGVFADSVYATGLVNLQPRDLVMLFTDGLYEVEGANEDHFGQDRLLELVQSQPERPTGELFDALLAALNTFSTSGGFHDDVCLVGMEYRG
jgi:sigma-B regulation protein RsbU (phosphoserine phosphatase)